ncbi:Hypothetical predicted protein [Paramuricea clavata]|uniref:Uncharacterized protein n=1 Tax=Paramuricea clavata TaxID=317549 RepID=A0A6S7KHL8_PARCT|nr:Hypothetical predicted protein [Paramuricea clavata]
MSAISRYLEIETLEPAVNNNFQQHVKVRGHKDLVENFEKKYNEKGFSCSYFRIERHDVVEVTVNPGISIYTTVGGVQLLKMQIIFILEGEGFKVNSMVFNQWNGTEKIMMYKEQEAPGQLSEAVKEG